MCKTVLNHLYCLEQSDISALTLNIRLLQMVEPTLRNKHVMQRESKQDLYVPVVTFDQLEDTASFIACPMLPQLGYEADNH